MDLRELVKKITNELETEYEGIEVTDEYAGPMRVTLNLIWDGFKGIPENERQEKVWELLHAKFKYADLKYVSYIITWTRAEKETYDREHVL